MKNRTFAKSLLLLTAYLSVALANAQDVQEVTLDEAVAYALEHSNSLKNVKLDILSAEAKVQETMSMGLPQVNANIGYTNNLVIQKALLPAQFLGDPTATGTIAVPFGVEHQGNWAIGLQQLVFDGTYFLGLKAAKEFVALSEKQSKLTEVQIVENVSKAYLNVLATEQRVKLLETTMKRLDTLIYETKELYANGFIEKNDLDRTQVTFNNMNTETAKVRELLNLSKEILKFQMGMEMAEEVNLKQTLKDFELDVTSILAQDGDYTNRPEYEVLDQSARLNLLNVKRYKVGYYPSVYANLNYGQNAGGNELGSFDRWWGYSTAGFSVSIPVFDGFRKKSLIQQAEIEVQKNQNQMADLKRSVELQKRQAAINLRSSVKTLEAQKRNMQLAKEVYRIAKLKHQEGVGSQLEVITANSDYDQAETNYSAALYNALIAKVDYQKAIGKLLNQ